MVTTSKNQKWWPSTEISDFLYFIFKNSKTTENYYKHEFSEKNRWICNIDKNN